MFPATNRSRLTCGVAAESTNTIYRRRVWWSQQVTTVWQKDRIAAACGQFSRIRQVAPMCSLSNTCGVCKHDIQTTRVGRYVKQVVTAIWRKGRIAAAHGRFNRIRQVAPMCTLCACFLRPTRVHIANNISIGSAVFAQLTAECPYTLQRAAPFRLNIADSHGGSGPHLLLGSLGPSDTSPQPERNLNPFSGFCVIDRPTDRQPTLLGL